MNAKGLNTSKKVAYILIIVLGIAEWLLVITKAHGGIHFYALFIAGIEQTLISFFKKSAFRWCAFWFTCMYGMLITYCIIFSVS